MSITHFIPRHIDSNYRNSVDSRFPMSSADRHFANRCDIAISWDDTICSPEGDQEYADLLARALEIESDEMMVDDFGHEPGICDFCGAENQYGAYCTECDTASEPMNSPSDYYY